VKSPAAARASIAPLPPRTAEEAASILVKLATQNDFTFYKYQIPDLVSHTGRIELAREVFGVIEQFVESVLRQVDPRTTTVIVTSDHGHLEQLGSSRGHPKSKVPTWYFGQDAERHATVLSRPEGIFHALTS
jgi:bisphosphoglycerate-independent phosphoglycerate mutase (AlkP superfamily)